jgi:hypothetical protein
VIRSIWISEHAEPVLYQRFSRDVDDYAVPTHIG